MQKSEGTAIFQRELFTAVHCTSEQQLGPGGQLEKDAGQAVCENPNKQK